MQDYSHSNNKHHTHFVKLIINVHRKHLTSFLNLHWN